jgi:hypothetical protein
MLGNIKEDYGSLATIPVIGLFEKIFSNKGWNIQPYGTATGVYVRVYILRVASVIVRGRHSRIKHPSLF